MTNKRTLWNLHDRLTRRGWVLICATLFIAAIAIGMFSANWVLIPTN